jgi:hypothetical protein
LLALPYAVIAGIKDLKINAQFSRNQFGCRSLLDLIVIVVVREAEQKA